MIAARVVAAVVGPLVGFLLAAIFIGGYLYGKHTIIDSGLQAGTLRYEYLSSGDRILIWQDCRSEDK